MGDNFAQVADIPEYIPENNEAAHIVGLYYNPTVLYYTEIIQFRTL